MNTLFLRVVIAVATAVTLLVLLGYTVWGLFAHQVMLSVVCALLVVPFAMFLYNDYRFFWGNKTTPKSS